MIYELRTYHCVPGQLPALLRRFETVTLDLFKRYEIQAVGFWTVVVGVSSQDFIYLIQWQSLADREDKWTRFQNDPDLAAARHLSERDGPLVASLTNMLLRPTSFSPGGKAPS
jgi:hypothetical protein